MEISERTGDEGQKDFVTPADRLLADQTGAYYKLSEAAKILNRSPVTLRRLMRTKKVKAPSYKVRQGGMFIYLFTPEDIEEIREYYGSQTPEKR